jgi:hypothetical protein
VNGSLHYSFDFFFSWHKCTSRRTTWMKYGAIVFKPNLLVYETCAMFGVSLALVDTYCNIPLWRTDKTYSLRTLARK